jgi:hypothetical protein
MALSGLTIHFFTVLVMPLILSLAMNDALQITQYYYDQSPCTVRYVMESVGRVSVMSCGLMALLYGTPALVQYPGLRDFGAAVLIGSAVILVITVMLISALLELFGRGQPLRGILSLEGELDI